MFWSKLLIKYKTKKFVSVKRALTLGDRWQVREKRIIFKRVRKVFSSVSITRLVY